MGRKYYRMVYDNFFWFIFIFINDWIGSDDGDYKFIVSDFSVFVYFVIDDSSFFYF